jgi:hypothetical protein
VQLRCAGERDGERAHGRASCTRSTPPGAHLQTLMCSDTHQHTHTHTLTAAHTPAHTHTHKRTCRMSSSAMAVVRSDSVLPQNASLSLDAPPWCRRSALAPAPLPDASRAPNAVASVALLLPLGPCLLPPAQVVGHGTQQGVQHSGRQQRCLHMLCPCTASRPRPPPHPATWPAVRRRCRCRCRCPCASVPARAQAPPVWGVGVCLRRMHIVCVPVCVRMNAVPPKHLHHQRRRRARPCAHARARPPHTHSHNHRRTLKRSMGTSAAGVPVPSDPAADASAGWCVCSAHTICLPGGHRPCRTAPTATSSSSSSSSTTLAERGSCGSTLGITP